MATPAERIIERFGGLTKLADALGHKHPTTVQGWKVRGRIPAKQQEVVLKLAKDRGLDLEPADFFASAASTKRKRAA